MGTFSKLTYHIVFGTKYRKPTLKKQSRDRIYEYIGGIVREHKGHLIEIGGVEDHVHLLVNLPPSLTVSSVVQQINGCSSKWINDEIKPVSKFEWQKGYSVFTVSYSWVNAVRQYIQNQEEHHRVRSFRDEYISLLLKHDIHFKPEYLFEDEHHG